MILHQKKDSISREFSQKIGLILSSF